MSIALSGRLAAAGGDSPVIDAIEGDHIVIIQTAHGNRVGVRGTQLSPGDRVKTGSRATARILYPDGSKLVIAKSSEVEIEDRKGGAQWNRLLNGTVRGQVKKVKPADDAPSAPVPGLHRFIVRSKGVVMGVRGTNFLFESGADQSAAIHTFEGTVDVAKSPEALAAGHSTPVQAGQFISADSQGAIGVPQTFDADAYAKRLKSEQPAFSRLSNEPEPKPEPSSAAAPPSEYHPQEKGPSPQELKMEAEKKKESNPRRTRLRLFAFQLGATRLHQQRSDGGLTTVEGSWNPELILPIIPFTIRGYFGFMPLKSRTDNERFIGVETAVMVGFDLFDPLVLELGFGQSQWIDHSKWGDLGLAQVTYRLPESRFINRIFVGYSYFDRPSDSSDNSKQDRDAASCFKAGVGMGF